MYNKVLNFIDSRLLNIPLQFLWFCFVEQVIHAHSFLPFSALVLLNNLSFIFKF